MPGTTKQQLYTAALLALGERKYLTSESTEAVRVLDEVYSGALEECLSQGFWNFGTITTVLKGDTGLARSDTGIGVYGPRYGFTMPTNYLRTVALSGDEYFSYPLSGYTQENNQIQADVTPIYLRYVSSDTGAGLELTSWPRLFARYVELELACRCCLRLTQSESLLERLTKDRDKARTRARSKDAMDEEQPRFSPPGAWTQSRGGQWGRERGSRGKLTG